MPDYTLVRFEKIRDTAKGDRVLRVALKNGDGQLLTAPNGTEAIFPEMWVAKDQPDPSPGPISGDLSFNEQYKAWSFKPQKQRGGGRGGGGWGAPKSPEERASIEAQVAAKVAGDIVTELAKSGKLELVHGDALHIAFTKLADTAFRAIHDRAKP